MRRSKKTWQFVGRCACCNRDQVAVELRRIRWGLLALVCPRCKSRRTKELEEERFKEEREQARLVGKGDLPFGVKSEDVGEYVDFDERSILDGGALRWTEEEDG